MKEVDLSFLQLGRTTECEYFSAAGDLLISRGVTLTQQHLEALTRRGIACVYMREEHEEDELHKILLAEFKELGNLMFDESQSQRPEPADAGDGAGPWKVPDFKDIKSGREGLIQLIRSRKGSELDARLKEGHTPDRPAGPSLKDRASQIKTSERTEQYRSKLVGMYEDSLRQTRSLLSAIVSEQSIDGGSVRNIVERFVRIYINDRNILLNLATIKNKDNEYIFNHSLNVCILSINIAASFGYNEQQVIEIGMGALLHDLGMLLLPSSILTKKGRLDEDEWYEIQKHPILGLHLLEKVSRLPESVPYVAYQSHERENGKGYPKQRSSRLIHCFAKILQIADVFEALSSPRPYREAHLPYKAMELVIKMTRQGLISGEFVKAFLEYTSLFPIGSIVELSNGCRGKIITANITSFAKPVVRILIGPDGKALPPALIYEEDLAADTKLQIMKALASDFNGLSLMEGF